VLAAVLVLATLALYWPATGNEFVSYDDDIYVTANPQVARGLDGESVAWAFKAKEASNWHPLTWISHLLDVQMFGLSPSGHHGTSIVLHALTAGLLFLLLRGATGATGASLAVAALFAVHPLNVQSVAWVSERKNVLSTPLWLLALGAYGLWCRRGRIGWYVAAFVLLALSLLAKPMAVTAPFTMLLLDYWPLGRWTLGQRRLWLEKLPFFALAAASSYVTFMVQREAGSVVAQGGLKLLPRLANAVWSYLAYLGYAIWPRGLAAYYPLEDSTALWRVVVAAVAIVAVTALVWWARTRTRAPLVGWLWYLGTLVPVIGVVQVGTQSMADRYMYVPLIGMFVAVAWMGSLLVAGGRLPREAVAGATAVAVVALGVVTLGQVAVWHDTVSLFESTVRAQPRAWVAHYNLGNAYETMGRHEDAIAAFRETIKLRPEFARAHNNLGNSLDAMGRVAEAVPSYERAVQLKPDLAEAYNNLGIAYANQGKPDQGVNALKTAILVRPDFMEAHLNLAITLRQLGKLPEARAEADQAVTLRPDHPLPRYHRALILVRLGETDLARRDLQVLQTLAPELAVRLQAALSPPSPAPAATPAVPAPRP
jgi:Flp pilus assembly protein TadD